MSMKKVSMIRKYHNHSLKTNSRHREEELYKITRHQKDKQSKATGSFFPIKMIVKLEWTHSNVHQNMEQKQNTTMGASINYGPTTTEPPP